jgi:microcystin-dependent protein
MSSPFVGEIRMYAGNFAPVGWMFCEGQLLAIAENDTLFQLIGITYGGDGQTTFALPDLRGRVPIHQGTGPAAITYALGESGGVETVMLTTNQLPVHTHLFQPSTGIATQSSPAGEVPAESANVQLYIEDVAGTSQSAQAVLPVGASQAHDNMQPYLCVSFIIALFGVSPNP